MDTSFTTPRPSPATLVECPWCDDPVELEPDDESLACPDCLVRVELAPAGHAPVVVGDRRLASAA
jgi:hypothetical protein